MYMYLYSLSALVYSGCLFIYRKYGMYMYMYMCSIQCGPLSFSVGFDLNRRDAVMLMSVYRLPHGQYGCSSHVLKLPQNAYMHKQNIKKKSLV